MAQVGCAGILVSDTICGPLAELPPEGQLLAVDTMPTKVGGCASNVAIDLAKQSITVDVVGCLGQDNFASVVTGSLQEAGVNCARIVYSKTLPTSKTVILLVAGQDRRYIHSFGANAAFTVGDIDRNWLRTLQVFYLGGLFLMPGFRFAELIGLLEFCRQHKVITVVDVVIPKNTTLPGDLRPLLVFSDYFLPNDDEARHLTGVADPFEQLRIFSHWGAHTVMITLGKRGVLAAQGGQYWQAGIYPIQPDVDPSGCGDAFDAGVITGILHGWDMPHILRYASALGGSAVRALGTTDGVFSSDAAEQFIQANPLPIITGSIE